MEYNSVEQHIARVNAVMSLNREAGLQYNSSILNNSRDKSKTTERYQETDDLAVIESLNAQGWFMTKYQQVNPHKGNAAIYKPYLATYRNKNLPEVPGEGALTLLQTSAKDGTRKHNIMLGFFRFACLNGMVCGTDIFEPISIKHIGPVPAQIVDIVQQVTEQVPLVNDRILEMKDVILTESQQLEFAKKAVELRFGEVNKLEKFHQVLNPNREADMGDDVWRVLNRCQENLTRKSTHLTTISSNGRYRKTQEVRNIDANLKINTGLWELAESYLQ